MKIHTLLQCTLLALFLVTSHAQVTDDISVLVVLVQWSDHDNRTLPTRDKIHQLWNGPGNSALVPGESVAEWVDSNTYGEYQITADVLEWYRVEETETQASFGNMGNIFNGVGTLEDILLPALTHAGDTYDLTDYADNFGHLTGIIFVHSGYAAEQGGELRPKRGPSISSSKMGFGCKPLPRCRP